MTSPPNKSRKSIGIVLVIVGVVVVVLFLIWQVFREPSDLSNACLDVLPQDKRVGMKFERGKDGSTVLDFAGQKGVQTGATPQQAEAFIKCLEATKNIKVTVENAVRLPLEPVGQVANRWSRESGLKLRLMPGSNNEALNNLRIGPATGRKEDVVRDWCSQQAGACVSCEPSQPTADTVEVLVRLRDNPPLEKRQLDGTWAVPAPGIQSEPWQIVNAKGERFYYECKRP